MWNAILNEQSSSKGFPNTNLLMLGRKNAGKRSLIDAITDISKTQYPKKSLNFCTIILG
jgi:predicted AAA+ superfamily ATPase